MSKYNFNFKNHFTSYLEKLIFSSFNKIYVQKLAKMSLHAIPDGSFTEFDILRKLKVLKFNAFKCLIYADYIAGRKIDMSQTKVPFGLNFLR